MRELRNVAERLAVFGTDPITVDQLPSSPVAIAVTTQIVPLREFRAQCEREYIESVLQRTNWNFTKAAELLKIQRTYLHQKVTSLGITRGTT